MQKSDPPTLPRGQQERHDFPRFGVWSFADYDAPESTSYKLHCSGDIEPITLIQSDLEQLERVEQVSNFHCVTTWSYRDVAWGGYRFNEFYEHFIQPKLKTNKAPELVVFRGGDKYKSSLLLEDALKDDVLLADSLNGAQLSAEHGAPLRVIAPAHYGYKNLKHLTKIEFIQDATSYRPRLNFAEHPRARVAYEERARYLPGWFFRYLYRPLIGMTVRKMKVKTGK